MKVSILVAAIALSVAFCPTAWARGGGHGGGFGSSTYNVLPGTGSNSSSQSVSGYTTKNGTYVAPHTATNPNSTRTDNYEAKGNYNPSNGMFGNKLVDK